MTTLAERVLKALKGPPKRTQRALAEACGINPVSVNDWVKGRTKTVEGAHLLKAAAFLHINPRWLAEGVGPMHADGSTHELKAAETTAAYATPKPPPINYRDRHEVTPSDWALLQDIKDAMESPRLAKRIEELRDDLKEMREYAEGVLRKRNRPD